MTLVRLRKAAQLTLPGEIRKALAVEEGDLLEASLVEGGVLLRPVAVVERAAAWRRIEEVQAGVRWQGPEPSEEEALKMAAGEVRAIRREADAARRRR